MLTKILMVATKKTISRCWFYEEPPITKQWMDTINTYRMEKKTELSDCSCMSYGVAEHYVTDTFIILSYMTFVK